MNPFRYIRDAMSAIIGAALAVTVTVLFYEGVPIGPLQYIPGIHYLIPEGRVAVERRKANEGYVLAVERDAAVARSAELERQLNAGRVALDMYAELLRASQTGEAEAEQKVSEYAQFLASSGRSCLLDQSDIDWLRK